MSDMAKHRLSDLQKGILKICYGQPPTKQWLRGRGETELNYVATPNTIIAYYDKAKWKTKASAQVSITRSIRNLFEKGLIDIHSSINGWVLLEQEDSLGSGLKWLDEIKNAPDDKVLLSPPHSERPFTKADLKRETERLKKLIQGRKAKELRGYVKMIKLNPDGVIKTKELLNVKKKNKN